MDFILSEIKSAVEQKSYYVAIMLTLAIPDICAALESDDGRTTGEKYKAWYTKHLQPTFKLLTAESCYSLRCGVFHQGRMELAGKNISYGRVIFTVPSPAGGIHNSVLNDALVFDAKRFCDDVVAVAIAWWAASAEIQNVARNAANLLQYRACGLLPYTNHMPVIA